VVTYEGDVLEVGSDKYNFFMKEKARYAGRPWKDMFPRNLKTKLFIVPRDVGQAASYAALQCKLSEVLKFNEHEKSK
jgi:hypothetical protein